MTAGHRIVVTTELGIDLLAADHADEPARQLGSVVRPSCPGAVESAERQLVDDIELGVEIADEADEPGCAVGLGVQAVTALEAARTVAQERAQHRSRRLVTGAGHAYPLPAGCGAVRIEQ